LRGSKSASTERSQVCRGRPGGRFQSLGSPRTDALRALLMSSEGSILTACPKQLVWWPKTPCPTPTIWHFYHSTLYRFRLYATQITVLSSTPSAQIHPTKPKTNGQTVILSSSMSLAIPSCTASRVSIRPESSSAVTTPTTTSPTSTHCKHSTLQLN